MTMVTARMEFQNWGSNLSFPWPKSSFLHCIIQKATVWNVRGDKVWCRTTLKKLTKTYLMKQRKVFYLLVISYGKEDPRSVVPKHTLFVKYGISISYYNSNLLKFQYPLTEWALIFTPKWGNCSLDSAYFFLYKLANSVFPAFILSCFHR